MQVADSVCSHTNLFPQHHFVVVYSKALEKMGKQIKRYDNVESLLYNYPKKDFRSLLTGRNVFLDNLVNSKKIDCVLTIFGPMKWRPRCSHICGFALPHLVLPESPYFDQLNFKQQVKSRISIFIDTLIFRQGAKFLYTENPDISERVKQLIKGCEVRTISNNYNQVFDHKERWKIKELAAFDGVSLLTLASSYPHKNLSISISIAKYLRKKHPDFKFRFVLSIKKEDLPSFDSALEKYFVFLDKVAIEECPSLYEQCDIAFLPSLLECFSAMYAEAMRMGLPIVTTDLPFARGLCDEAALYYDPLDAESAAKRIYELTINPQLADTLVKYGYSQLKKFDDSQTRAEKLIEYCQDVFKSK